CHSSCHLLERRTRRLRRHPHSVARSCTRRSANALRISPPLSHAGDSEPYLHLGHLFLAGRTRPQHPAPLLRPPHPAPPLPAHPHPNADVPLSGLVGLLDPFGGNAVGYLTQYWTPFQRNTQLVPLTGVLLWNRLLWFSLGAAILVFPYFRFSFTYAAERARTR